MTNPETHLESESLEDLTALSILASETEENKGIGLRNVALLRRRAELGLTQKQLAEKVGLSAAYIVQFETLRYFPNLEQRARLTEVLGMDPCPEWLKLFTRDKKQPAQIRMEIPESEVNPVLLKKAHERYERETTLNNIEDPYIVAERRELGEILEDVLASITQRERGVLKLRSGLENGKSYTLEETAEIFKVSRERIRVIAAQALRKLRHSSRAKKLKDFLDEKPGDLRSSQALINGAVNALHQGDRERAIKNLDEIEKKCSCDFAILCGVERLRAKIQKD